MSNTSKDGIRRRSVRLEDALSRLTPLINWEKRSRTGMDVSLEPVRDLVARLGSPEQTFRAVHVAGSKGKGTTAALVEAALRGAGLPVALYTSPHLERLEERLRLAGEEVEGEVLAAALERALEARAAALAAGSPARDSTWFDVLTSAAFLAIAEAGIPLAVVEVGLGGRLDSTNVVHGPVTAVTSIYLEHTSVLGSTRAAIAREKAGIVKPGGTVVFGALGPADEAAAVIDDIAHERGARSVRVEHAPGDPLAFRNERLARAILAELVRAEPELVRDPAAMLAPDAAWTRTALPGRAERRRVGATRIVLDGAHVPESLALVLRDLRRDPELARPPVVVLGMGREKNAEGLLKALRGRVDRVLCSSVGEGPTRGAEELAAIGRGFGIAAHAVPDPAAALDEAVRAAGTEGWVLVTGSLHLVGAVRRLTGN